MVAEKILAEEEAMVVVADAMVTQEASVAASAKATAICLPGAEEAVLGEAGMVVDEIMTAVSAGTARTVKKFVVEAG